MAQRPTVTQMSRKFWKSRIYTHLTFSDERSAAFVSPSSKLEHWMSTTRKKSESERQTQCQFQEFTPKTDPHFRFTPYIVNDLLAYWMFCGLTPNGNEQANKRPSANWIRSVDNFSAMCQQRAAFSVEPFRWFQFCFDFTGKLRNSTKTLPSIKASVQFSGWL